MYLTTHLMQKPETFEVTIAKQSKWLLDKAKYLCKSTRIEPEDLAQDAIIKAITTEFKLEPGTNLKGWLYTILKNLFINEYRRNKKLIDIELKDNMPFSAPNDAIRSLSVEEIRAVFATLPPKQRKMVELRADGYGYEQIAEIMELPMGTVRSTLHKAKYKIQDNFKGENYGE